ncbi:uncharacterized protein I303_107146 [Kwoniella dejecticola CBS 10117]|uniref:NUDE domain-containing protein n=1 Tax=Kwoniella dejecticola CBS 10117 TaxID=1296121 RepID=A0A1A5ZYV6_9TREE|nr:uncharacterized protein I303_06547 [Kwoniella dejecticola CBS 10117]OBR82989.1 hypothetical protein I303_06547 [Kwoniella dejecticola CBS 10117]
MSAGLPIADPPPSANGFGHSSVHKMPSSSTMGWEDEEENATFESPQEEISHYREKYRQAMYMLSETRAELEEFTQSSKELEDEMEAELANVEKVQMELKEKIKRLELEKEEWKSKQIALQKMHSSTTAAMQREMDNLRSERDKTLVALRDLEMGNDELERNERVAVSSLLDLESKYNRAIEEKTLLEQEIIQKQEVEEECQRLKDDMRDANNEISILRDQLSRMTLPTPPSSISEPVSSSPMQEPVDLPEEVEEIDPASIPLPPPVPYKLSQSSGIPQSPSRRLPRSATSSSIPMASPIAKRFNSSIPQSPTMSSLSRSTTSRNLAAVAKTPGSPASAGLSRSRAGLLANTASPGTVRVASHNQTKSRGFKLLHDLQARLKATDDKLGVAKVPRRNVSNPLNFGARSTSAASGKSTKDKDNKEEKQQAKVVNPRVTALAQSQAGGGTPMTSSNSSFMSPNGWVLVDGEEDDFSVTPTTSTTNGFITREEPLSPLDATFGVNTTVQPPAARAVSSASNSSQRSLPSRPGIPSPLTNVNGTANGLGKSTTSTSTSTSASTSAAAKVVRKPSNRHPTVPFPTTNNPAAGLPTRTGISKTPLSPTTPSSSAVASTRGSASASASSSRPISPSMIPTSSRPMSPSLLSSLSSNSSSRPISPSAISAPQYNRIPLRAPSPSIPMHSSSSSSSRPQSRLGLGGIGKGPPPSFNNHRPHHGNGNGNGNTSTSLSSSQNGNGNGNVLRRSTRRSSVGVHELPTGIPAPRERDRDGARTPIRPVTIHGDTPPPVPRIPSALRRK